MREPSPDVRSDSRLALVFNCSQRQIAQLLNETSAMHLRMDFVIYLRPDARSLPLKQNAKCVNEFYTTAT